MTTVTRPALLSAMAYMLQAAGITVRELAQHMGHKLEAAPIVIPPRPERAPDALVPRVAEALRHCDNPDGASIPELMAIMGLSIRTVSLYVGELQNRGRIVRVKAPGVRAPRCFVDPAAAQRWVDSHQQAQDAALQAVRDAAAQKQGRQQQAQQERAAERQRKAGEKQAEKDRRKRERDAAEARRAEIINARQNVTFHPPRVPTGHKLQGEAVETAATRRTVDDTKRPVARWDAQELPADPRWPSFSSTKPGQHPDTGKEWGRA